MEIEVALQQATNIASLILHGSRDLGRNSIRDLSLMASLSVMMATSARDTSALSPRIKEIILFGSTARGEKTPGDIDMMVFDAGFYSNIMGASPTEGARTTRRTSSWGGLLRNNLGFLLEGWFGYSSETVHAVGNFPVDLQILPIAVITDPSKRQELGKKHFDPKFFENAFSTILRFDKNLEKFVPTTLDELAQKHLRPGAEELEEARGFY